MQFLNQNQGKYLALVMLKNGKTFEMRISAMSKSDANEIVRKEIATEDIVSVGICPAHLFDKQVA